MPVPALKTRSSFHKLKQRVGLDKDKKLPPTPTPLATVVTRKSADVDSELSSSRTPSHGAAAETPGADDPPSHPSKTGPLKPVLSPPLPPPSAPLQHQSSMPLLKKSNPLVRMASRFLHKDTPQSNSTAVPPGASSGPDIPLLSTLREKAPRHAADRDPTTAQARREEALRARGLRPIPKTKYLSDIEAEENARIGVVETHSHENEGPSEAAVLVDSWRARNASPSPPSSPLHRRTVSPPPPSPRSPRSTRSRRSGDSHEPARTELTGGSTDKVTEWLQQRSSPPSSPRSPTRAARTSEGERLAAFTMPRGPRAPPPSKSRMSAESERSSADLTREGVTTRVLPDSPDRELPTHLFPPPSPILPSSSSEASCTEPLTPSTTSASFRPRGFNSSGSRGAPPAGMAPIIVETAEEGIMRNERAIFVVDEDEDGAEFGKSLPPVPESAPATTTTTTRTMVTLAEMDLPPRTATLRPPGKGKGERRSLGFLFNKPSRSATLPPEQHQGLNAAKSVGDLRRGITLSVPSRGSRRPAAAALAPVTPLAPTMHSQASIVDGVQYIDDEESRRLSELAFVC